MYGKRGSLKLFVKCMCLRACLSKAQSLPFSSLNFLWSTDCPSCYHLNLFIWSIQCPVVQRLQRVNLWRLGWWAKCSLLFYLQRGSFKRLCLYAYSNINVYMYLCSNTYIESYLCSFFKYLNYSQYIFMLKNIRDTWEHMSILPVFLFSYFSIR